MILKKFEDGLFNTLYWDPTKEALADDIEIPKEVKELYKEYKEFLKSEDNEELIL